MKSVIYFRINPKRPFDPRHGVGAAFLMILCFTISTIALSIYGPMLMKVIYGASALTAGYVLVLEAIAWSLFAFLSSGAAEKHDGQLIVTGMALVTISIIGLAFSTPYGSLTLIAVFAFLQGAGFGMSWTFILRKVSSIAAVEERDRVASALPTLQRLGYAVGAALIGIVANALGFTEDLELLTARSVGFWIFALSMPFALIGLLACYRFISAGAASNHESAQASV